MEATCAVASSVPTIGISTTPRAWIRPGSNMQLITRASNPSASARIARSTVPSITLVRLYWYVLYGSGKTSRRHSHTTVVPGLARAERFCCAFGSMAPNGARTRIFMGVLWLAVVSRRRRRANHASDVSRPVAHPLLGGFRVVRDDGFHHGALLGQCCVSKQSAGLEFRLGFVGADRERDHAA